MNIKSCGILLVWVYKYVVCVFLCINFVCVFCGVALHYLLLIARSFILSGPQKSGALFDGVELAYLGRLKERVIIVTPVIPSKQKNILLGPRVRSMFPLLCKIRTSKCNKRRTITQNISCRAKYKRCKTITQD